MVLQHLADHFAKLKKIEFPILLLFALIAVGSIVYGLSIKNTSRFVNPPAIENQVSPSKNLFTVLPKERAEPSEEAERAPTPVVQKDNEPLPIPLAVDLTVVPAIPVADIGIPPVVPTPSL